MAMAAIVLAAFATAANAQVQGGFFIGGNVGASYYHDHGLDDRSDIASTLRAGYEWRTDEFLDDRFGFGVELGYADLGKAHGKVAGELYKNGQFEGYAIANASLKTTGPTLGGTFRYRFRDRWYLNARAGYMHAQLHSTSRTDLDGESYRGSGNLHADGGYAGIGVGYDYNEHFSLGLEYDGYYAKVRQDGIRYDSDVGVISGAATYRF